MPPHPLNNFETQKYYQNEPRFNGAYSRDNLQKIKGESYAANLDEYFDIGTHWIALYVKNNDVTYFDSFGQQKVRLNKINGIKDYFVAEIKKES